MKYLTDRISRDCVTPCPYGMVVQKVLNIEHADYIGKSVKVGSFACRSCKFYIRSVVKGEIACALEKVN